ncbi:LOW QUALITY PROTEIN: Hypothetical protein PHPALM_13151, partial [Phytophthora palmivora]
MKLKLSPAVRNWRANLRPKIRRKWKDFLKAFKERYCKVKTPDAERHYTMFQKKSELDFYYRLNKVADRAGIQIDGSSKYREQHLKAFTKKLLDSRLRTTLQGQRLRSLEDVEYVLKQHEDLTLEDDYDTPPPKRDFRADNVPRDKFRMKRSGRAYLAKSEDDSDEGDRHVKFEDEEKAASETTTTKSDNQETGFPSMENLSEAVYKILHEGGPSLQQIVWIPGDIRNNTIPDVKVSGTPIIPPDTVRTAGTLGISRKTAGQTSSVNAVIGKAIRYDSAGCGSVIIVASTTRDTVGSMRQSKIWKTLSDKGLWKYQPLAIRKKLLDSDADSGEQHPLDGDPERVGLKKPPELCVLAYVGPELKKQQVNHQCMTITQDDSQVPDSGYELFPDVDVDSKDLDDDWNPDNLDDTPVEFRLKPGERYGWWEEHRSETSKRVAMVHGAVNNIRTDILLDSGASVSMLSLDLARRLKLKLNFRKQLRVSQKEVETVDLRSGTVGGWVANIGEGVDVLLGMDFMYSAGVRLCIREGLVQLPDEENVMLSGRTFDQQRKGLRLEVRPPEPFIWGQGNKRSSVSIMAKREVVWAGRGDRWVTQLIYGAKSWAVAVKVVNISEKDVCIDTNTPVAQIVEFGCYPFGRFVRPGLRRYREWEVLIYENTNSRQEQLRQRRYLQAIEASQPPSVRKPEYPWPKKLLTRPPRGGSGVHMVCLQDPPRLNAKSVSDPDAMRLNVRNPEGLQTISEVSEGIWEEPPEAVKTPEYSCEE